MEPLHSLKDEEKAERKQSRPVSPSPSIESCQQPMGRKKRGRVTKNTVSFNESVRVRRTITRNEFEEKELLATWYQKTEFEMIRRKICMLVRKVQQDGAHLGQDKKYCTRGLESLFTVRSEMKAETRSKVSQAVFFEQAKKFLASSEDDEAIAAASIKLSLESQLMALSIGQRDQMEAHKVYRMG